LEGVVAVGEKKCRGCRDAKGKNCSMSAVAVGE